MDVVLSLLEEGREKEKASNAKGALEKYEEATQRLRAILPAYSTKNQTYDMLLKELLHYETKIHELKGVDLFDNLEDEFDSALDILETLPVVNKSAEKVKSLTITPPPVPVAPAARPKFHETNSDPAWKGANKNRRFKNYEHSILTKSKATDACLSDLEIEVLKDSSRINGLLFMPWLEGEEKEECFRYDHDWCDPAGLLPLSSKLKDAGAVYLRPSEFFVAGKVNMISTRFPDPNSIVQDCVGDCSLVCSLIISSLYECKTKQRLVSGIIYPHDGKGWPVVNKSGKYLVKLFLNGVFRKVVIDDRLPCRRNNEAIGASLLCASSKRDNELWVSIIEKAFLKVHGGYDFAGSNSGIDLYTLTGWIPEQVHLHNNNKNNQSFEHASDDGNETSDGQSPRKKVATFDHRQDKGRVWERMVSAHQFGDCLITVSTRSDLSEEEMNITGLIPSHAYAVLDVQQAGTLRMLKIKNPWADNPWKGRFSSHDRQRWTKGLRRVLGVGGESADSANAAFDKMQQEGIFYIELEDLLRYFDGIFMNWNPSLFSFRLAIHDFWPASRGPKNDLYYRGANPQYSLIVDPTLMDKSTLKGLVVSVWILFSRHITESKAESCPENDVFMAVHVYKSIGGARIFDNPRPYIKGLYSNNPHQLVRVDVDMSGASVDNGGNSSTNEMTIVLSQMDKSRDLNFSVSTYGTTPYIFRRAPSPGRFKYEFCGDFDAQGCGTVNHDTFFTNPQFFLTSLSAGGSNTEPMSSVHVEAFYTLGISAAIHVVEINKLGQNHHTRVDNLPDKASGKSLQESGAYRKGYCHIPNVMLKQDCSYVVVLSTYKQHPEGSYRFNVYSTSSNIRCEALEAQGEGLIHRLVEGNFKEDLHQGQKGGVKLYSALDRLLIQPTGGTQGHSKVVIMARLRLAPGEGASFYPLNLGIFDNSPNASKDTWSPKAGSSAELLSTTHDGIYVDAACGVFLDYSGLWPDHGNGFAIIPSCFDKISAKFLLDVYTSCNVVMRWEKQL